MAGAGRGRSRRGDHRRGECHRARARRARPTLVDRGRGRRRSRSGAGCAGGHRSSRGVLPGYVAVVDRGPRRRGTVRSRRAPLLRDRPRGLCHVVGPRGRSRSRLLALLRVGRRRPVEQCVDGLPRQPCAPAPRLHAGRGRARRPGAHTVAGPTLARRAAVRRRGGGDRCPPAGRCVGVRPAPVRRSHPFHTRARAAQLDPGRAARGAQPQSRARRARFRHRRLAAHVGPSDRGGCRCRQPGQPAGVGDRRVRRRFATPTRSAGVVAAGGRRTRSTRRRACARAAGPGVRRLPLGYHHRPDPSRAHHAAAAHARPAPARRRPAHEPAVRARPTLPGRHDRAGGGRAGREAPRCHRCRRPARRQLGALRHAASGGHLGGAFGRAGARPGGRVRAGAHPVDRAARPRPGPRHHRRRARVGGRPRRHRARQRRCRGDRAYSRCDACRRRRRRGCRHRRGRAPRWLGAAHLQRRSAR